MRLLPPFKYRGHEDSAKIAIYSAPRKSWLTMLMQPNESDPWFEDQGSIRVNLGNGRKSGSSSHAVLRG